jgi:hypothetical protein
MSEENTQATSTEPVVTEPSLDDVISEYNVQPAAPAATQPATVSNEPATIAPVQPVDPLDTNQFNSYVSQVNNGQSVLSNQLQDVKSELTELRQEQANLQIEADINSAVGSINEGLNLDPKLVRVHLELTAQEKPGFRRIWENREANPQAYTKALKALSNEIGDKYSARQDPELTANQQAIQQSQQSRATTATPDGSGNQLQDKLGEAKSDGDFDREWQRMIHG